MLATAHNIVERLVTCLAKALVLAAVSALTVGNGILPALFIAMGDCPINGSSGC